MYLPTHAHTLRHKEETCNSDCPKGSYLRNKQRFRVGQDNFCWILLCTIWKFWNVHALLDQLKSQVTNELSLFRIIVTDQQVISERISQVSVHGTSFCIFSCAFRLTFIIVWLDQVRVTEDYISEQIIIFQNKCWV